MAGSSGQTVHHAAENQPGRHVAENQPEHQVVHHMAATRCWQVAFAVVWHCLWRAICSRSGFSIRQSGIFLKKRAGIRVWVSVALAVAGLYLLCITDRLALGKGDILVLLCAVVFAVHILVVDHFSAKTDGVRMSCIQFLVCGLLSGVCMLLTEHPEMPLILQAWQPILYAGVFSCGVGYTLQIVGQKGTDPTVASLILSLESVVSVLAGWLLLGQRLSVRELGGCALMFAAILLAQMPERRQS